MPFEYELMRGLRKHRKQRFEEAGAIYRAIIEAMPTHAEALHLMGILEADQGRYVEGREFILKALAVKQSSTFYFTLGDIDNRIGESEQAFQAWENAFALDPTNTAVAHQLALLCSKQNKYESALTWCHKALSLQPAAPEVCQELHWICALGYEAQKDVEKAISSLETVMQYDSQRLDAIIKMAELQLTQGDIEAALIYLERWQALVPEAEAPVLKRSALLHQTSRTAQALQMLKEYALLHPENTSILLPLAQYSYAMNDYLAALEYYIRAFELNPPVSGLRQKLIRFCLQGAWSILTGLRSRRRIEPAAKKPTPSRRTMVLPPAPSLPQPRVSVTDDLPDDTVVPI